MANSTSPSATACSTSGDRSKVASFTWPSLLSAFSAARAGGAAPGAARAARGDPLVGVGGVGEVDGEDLALAARLAHGVGEALTAKVEGGVADLLVDADGVADPG